jgi:hypothetical protein
MILPLSGLSSAFEDELASSGLQRSTGSAPSEVKVISGCKGFFLMADHSKGVQSLFLVMSVDFEVLGATALAAAPASDIKSLLIGMNDISAPWSWIDRAPVTYTNWVPTEPHSSVGGGEDYGGILLNFWKPAKRHDLRFKSGDVVHAVVEVPDQSTFVMACLAIVGIALTLRRR